LAEAEFDALGVPFKERGRRMDEGIAMMKAVWSQDPMTFGTKWISAKISDMRSPAATHQADPDLDWWIVRRRDQSRSGPGWLARVAGSGPGRRQTW